MKIIRNGIFSILNMIIVISLLLCTSVMALPSNYIELNFGLPVNRTIERVIGNNDNIYVYSSFINGEETTSIAQHYTLENNILTLIKEVGIDPGTLPIIINESNGFFVGMHPPEGNLSTATSFEYGICTEDCLSLSSWNSSEDVIASLEALMIYPTISSSQINKEGYYWTLNINNFNDGDSSRALRVYDKDSNFMGTIDFNSTDLPGLVEGNADDMILSASFTAFELNNGFGWLLTGANSEELNLLSWDPSMGFNISSLENPFNELINSNSESEDTYLHMILAKVSNEELQIALINKEIASSSIHFVTYERNSNNSFIVNRQESVNTSSIILSAQNLAFSRMINNDIIFYSNDNSYLIKNAFLGGTLNLEVSNEYFSSDIPLHIFNQSGCGNLAIIEKAEDDQLNLSNTDIVKYYANTTCEYASIDVPNQISLLAPSTIDPYLDNNFSITLNVDSETPLFGTEISCTFSNNHVQITNYTYVNWADNVLQVPMSFDTQVGTWSGAQSLIMGENPLTGEVAFAAFDLLADMTTATWDMNCSGLGSDELANPIPLQSNSISIQIDDGIHGGSSIISGTISIPGQTDNSGVTVSIIINDREIQATTDASGAFSFEALREGSFTVHVVHDQFVAACNTLELTEGGVLESISIDMIPGDINSDGIIDIGDFTFLSGRFGLDSSSIDYDNKADLNDDDIINILDLTLLGSHFGSEQCNTSL